MNQNLVNYSGEIKEIHDNRKKYREEDLRAKMQRISNQLRECGKI